MYILEVCKSLTAREATGKAEEVFNKIPKKKKDEHKKYEYQDKEKEKDKERKSLHTCTYS